MCEHCNPHGPGPGDERPSMAELGPDPERQRRDRIRAGHVRSGGWTWRIPTAQQVEQERAYAQYTEREAA